MTSDVFRSMLLVPCVVSTGSLRVWTLSLKTYSLAGLVSYWGDPNSNIPQCPPPSPLCYPPTLAPPNPSSSSSLCVPACVWVCVCVCARDRGMCKRMNLCVCVYMFLRCVCFFVRQYGFSICICVVVCALGFACTCLCLNSKIKASADTRQNHCADPCCVSVTLTQGQNGVC